MDENDLYLYVFGGKKCATSIVKNGAELPKLRWKLRLTKNLDWRIQRLIWIGFYKNNNANQDRDNMKACIFSQMPKDVTHFVLSFFRRQFLFDHEVQ